jgi:hypothetical protein
MSYDKYLMTKKHTPFFASAFKTQLTYNQRKIFSIKFQKMISLNLKNIFLHSIIAIVAKDCNTLQ